MKVKNKSSFQVVLKGFAGRSSNPEYNLQLSKNRAIEVTKYLVNHGIAKEVIRSLYKGADLSLKPNEQTYGRRVEVLIGNE